MNVLVLGAGETGRAFAQAIRCFPSIARITIGDLSHEAPCRRPRSATAAGVIAAIIVDRIAGGTPKAAGVLPPERLLAPGAFSAGLRTFLVDARNSSRSAADDLIGSCRSLRRQVL